MCSLGKVSIIIPTHKGRDLTKVMKAIGKSTYPDIEIIVIDRGLERSKQRNIGINEAKGKYLLILDSDMLVSPKLIEDCVNKIQNANGVYMKEKIMTPGLFARIRDWERQFYTGTAIDCVRFVRKKDCPYFDVNMHGPEDSDWDRLIPEPKAVSDHYYYHYEDCNMIQWFKKKSYYAGSMDRFIRRHPDDKILDLKYRCWTVFTENGKWRKLFHPFIIGVLFIILVRGLIMLWKKL